MREVVHPVVAGQNMTDERRRFKRVPVDFPAAFDVHGTPVPGWALNACNEGMMVESVMSLDMALHILYRLKKSGRDHLFLEFSHKGTHRTEAEIKHIHLQFLGGRLCRSQIGFFIPRIRHESTLDGKSVDPRDSVSYRGQLEEEED